MSDMRSVPTLVLPALWYSLGPAEARATRGEDVLHCDAAVDIAGLEAAVHALVAPLHWSLALVKAAPRGGTRMEAPPTPSSQRRQRVSHNTTILALCPRLAACNAGLRSFFGVLWLED